MEALPNAFIINTLELTDCLREAGAGGSLNRVAILGARIVEVEDEALEAGRRAHVRWRITALKQ